MKELTKNECELIVGGRDLFSYDLFYAIGAAVQAFRDAGNEVGSNSYTMRLRMGGL